MRSVKTGLRFFGWVLPALLALQSVADTFELNCVKGLWQFNGDLEPYWGCQSAAVANGFTIDGMPGSRYVGSHGGAHWLDLRSDQSPYGGLQMGENMIFPHAASVNGPAGATRVNEWTIMMDVRIPTNASTGALVRHAPSTGDCEIYLNPDKQIIFFYANGPAGAHPVASDPIPTNTWVRLTFSSEYDSLSEHNILRAYVDGVATPQSASGDLWALPNGHYGLDPTAFSLFSHSSGTVAPIEVNSVAFWASALSDADIASLGGSDADGIDWAEMTAVDGWPPLPPLNGKLMFGSFETEYTPDMAAIAATANVPFYFWAVAEVRIDLGTNGGRIPGMPDHTFGGSQVTAFIRPDGTAVANDPVLVHHSPALEDDCDTIGDVTFLRRGITLTTEGALCSLLVYLPAGFGVNTSTEDAVLRDNFLMQQAPLNAQLQPSNEVFELTSVMFGYTPSALLCPVLDRVPVRFSTQELSWYPQEGVFHFEQAAQGQGPFYTRAPQLALAADQQAQGYPGAAIVPPSNDGYFIAAGVPEHAPVIVMARPEGAALLKDLTVSLDATALGGTYTGFVTHYPVMSVRWTGSESQIHFVDDAIDYSRSRLTGPLPSLTSYRRAVLAETNACAGVSVPIPDENIWFDPGAEGFWFITPDGGLYAWGRLSSTPELDGQSFTPEWGGFRDTNGVVKFTHAVTTNDAGEGGFSYGEVLTSGTAVRNDATLVKPLPEGQRVASILLTGFSEECTRVERPGTATFSDGLANYAGVNLRGWESPAPHTAKSIIAGTEIKPSGYELAREAKYCIRPGGVSGVHVAATNSEHITFEAYGSEFELTRLMLSYRDGVNIDSGVGGGVYVHEPADVSVIFERLLLGTKGELKSAGIMEGQVPTLGSATWKMKFTPLTLDFPQAEGICPPPQPDQGFIRVGATAELPGLGGGGFTGNLSFFDGNIVSESLPVDKNGVPIANGIENVSRFATESVLLIAGTEKTGGKPWSVNPVTGISVNRLNEGAEDGTLTVGGLMDLPFFVDLPVILSTGSKNVSGNGAVPPQLYVRNPWPAASSLEVQIYDPAHLGYPQATTLDDYRSQDTYDPIATRDWQNLISFALPVRMDEDRVIRSRTSVTNQTLLLFNLTETVRSMTPDSAEITLDGRSTAVLEELTRQVNVGTLLGNSTLEGAEAGVQDAVDGALDSIRHLDATLADHSHPLLDPGLNLLAEQEATADFFDDLREASSPSERKDLLDLLVGDNTHGLTHWVLRMFYPQNDDPGYSLDGQWRRDISQPITDAVKGLEASRMLVSDDNRITALAQALALRMGLSQETGEPDTARREAIALLFEQTIQRLRVAESEMAATEGKLTIALWAALGETNTVQPILQQAINDLKPKWAPSDPAQATLLYEGEGAKEDFVHELSLALADRFAESAFAASCGTLLRQYLSDPQTMARQALDDTLRMACTLVADTVQPGETLHANGKLHDYLLADNLCGYARICGDSLHELRLDGRLTLQAHDKLPKQKFDGWCLLRDVDSATPGTDGISEGDITAEILAGATTLLEWGTQKVDMTLGAKIGLNAAGDPVSFMGDMALEGSIGLCAITVNTLKLGVGIGPDDAYFYGRTAGRMGDMKVAVGAFFGKTHDIEILKIADRDIGSVLSAMSPAMPVTGMLAYGEGDMSLMPLLSIPPSCVLDLRVGGGQGFCALLDDDGSVIGGFKIAESVTGEVLCICNVTGRFGSVLMGAGQFKLDDLLPPKLDSKYLYTIQDISGRAWTTLEGEVGYDPFSCSFEKTFGLTLDVKPTGEVKWDVDY